jgi:hypothetical protein
VTTDGAAAGHGDGAPAEAPQHIVCVDCGGRCHLLTHPPRDEDGRVLGFRAGDIVAYRCEDCLDRWDIELEA